MGIDVLFLNAIIYIATLVFAINKFRKLNLYVVIWLAYSVVAFAGYYSVKANLHYAHDVNLGYKVSPIPYIFAYSTILLLSSPFYKINVKRISLSKLNIPFVQWLSYLVIFANIVRLIYSILLYQFVSNNFGGGEAYLMIHEGETVFSIDNIFVNKIVGYSSIITSSLNPLLIVFYFNRIVKRKGQWWVNFVLILLAFLPIIIIQIATASKGGLYYISFSLLFYYVLFKPSIPKQINKKILSIIASGGFILLLLIAIFTEDRIQVRNSLDSPIEELTRYLGESYPNLGWEYYERVRENPNGRRFFPEFFNPNPEKLYTSLVDGKFDYWTPKTGVRMELLKTFWGDWYVEFGMIGSFIAILLLFAICYWCFLKRYWLVSSLPLVAYYYDRILIRGCFAGSGLEGSNTHQALFYLIISCFIIFYYVDKKNAQKFKF